VTHDSWVASQEILDAFEKQSGIKISVLKQGATRAR
jgi:thiamine transport system substrate-binding protein